VGQVAARTPAEPWRPGDEGRRPRSRWSRALRQTAGHKDRAFDGRSPVPPQRPSPQPVLGTCSLPCVLSSSRARDSQPEVPRWCRSRDRRSLWTGGLIRPGAQQPPRGRRSPWRRAAPGRGTRGRRVHVRGCGEAAPPRRRRSPRQQPGPAARAVPRPHPRRTAMRPHSASTWRVPERFLNSRNSGNDSRMELSTRSGLDSRTSRPRWVLVTTARFGRTRRPACTRYVVAQPTRLANTDCFPLVVRR
jgi:hypothetical protein